MDFSPLLTCGLIGAGLAYWKNRSIILWFFISALTVGVGVLVLVFMPRIKSPEANAAETDATEINKDAVNDEAANTTEVAAASPKKGKSSIISKIILIAIAVAIAFFIAQSANSKKQKIEKKTFNTLMEICSDQECKSKVEKNFPDCSKNHIKSVKSGKRSYNIEVDSDGLMRCIGLI